MSDLSENTSSSFDSVENYESYDDYFKIHKALIIEKLHDVTQTDRRMSESQKKGFYKAFHDLVPQEPTLEEMDLALKSYVAHFDHIPSVFAFVKHFGRFRTGMLPNKRGESLKKIQQQERDLKLERWANELKENPPNV